MDQDNVVEEENDSEARDEEKRDSTWHFRFGHVAWSRQGKKKNVGENERESKKPGEGSQKTYTGEISRLYICKKSCELLPNCEAKKAPTLREESSRREANHKRVAQ